MRSDAPDYSVIIEWDNPRLSRQKERQREVLQRLADQMRQAGRRGEVLIVYDQNEAEGTAIDALLQETLNGLPTRAIATAGLRYYQQKNEGIRQSRGSVLLILDSDAMPDSSWLESHLRSFDDPAVQIAGGATYVEPRGIYQQAMALCWFFPLRPPDGRIYAETRFFANNVSFRKDMAEKFSFPEETNCFRGQCTTLAETLTRQGIPIYRNPNATVTHPVPDGAYRFIQKALCHGHDLLHAQLLKGRNRWVSAYLVLGQALRRMALSQRRVCCHWRSVGMPAFAVPIAATIALAHDLLVLLGILITALDTRFFHRHCPM